MIDQRAGAEPPTVPRVAYQGVPGAFGEAAVHRHWNGGATAIGAPSFDAALELVAENRAEWAVIPIWNSSIGAIDAGCRALDQRADIVGVVDHVELAVRHCLLARPGTAFDDLRFVGSHPAALAQCRRLFAAHDHLTPCDASDTAGAACELALAGEPLATVRTPGARVSWFSNGAPVEPTCLGAIASAAAAERYGLSILLENVQDDPANDTRFAVAGPRESARW